MRGLKIGNQANQNKPGSRQKASLDPKDGSDSVNVKTYDVTSGTESARTVKKDSPADKVSKEFGKVINFGKSVSQEAPTGSSTTAIGTNRNTKATMSTTGSIGGNKPFSYTSEGKVYKYVPGEQNKNPKTGRRL